MALSNNDVSISSKNQKILAIEDPELANLITMEEKRQRSGIELIASENFTSQSVLECLGSCLTNKYSEGQPGNRYYGGTKIVDQIELLCKERCLQAFQLDPEIWSVNVQPYSGSPANFAVYAAFLQPHDRLMGLHLTSGGHLTHGYYTPKKRISFTSVFFESFPYGVEEKTGLIDLHGLLRDALAFQPKLIICGASSYPRIIPYEEFRNITNEIGNGCLLMADMSHVAGLVAGAQHPSPFEYCDIVTTTTHKTLRGPRSGLIFINKKRLGIDAEEKLNSAVFPGLQGGPHNHQIAGVARQMKEVASPIWKIYASQVVANAKALAAGLIDHKQTIVTGGTDNHLVLWDLRPLEITGSKLEKVADAVAITLNKNTLPGDSSAFSPGGVRLGSPAMTTRGCTEEDMYYIASLLVECAGICLKIQETSGKTLKAFIQGIENREDIRLLALKVKEFSEKFNYPSLSHNAC